MKYIDILKAKAKRGNEPSQEELDFRVTQSKLQAQNYLNELRMKQAADKDAIRVHLNSPSGALDFAGIVELKSNLTRTETEISVAEKQIQELFD